MSNEPTRNLQDATLYIEDALAAHSLEIICEEGDLAWSEPSNQPKVIKDRQSLCHMRPPEEEPVTLSFSLHYKYSVAHGTEPLSPYEVFHQQNGAVAWTSTAGVSGPDVFTVTLRFVLDNPDSTGEDETIKFEKVPLPNISFEEGDEADGLSFEGIAFVTKPSIFRGTTTTTTTAA